MGERGRREGGDLAREGAELGTSVAWDSDL